MAAVDSVNLRLLAVSDDGLRKQLNDAIDAHGFEDLREPLLAVARRAVSIRPLPLVGEAPLGSSRLGGAPDLPKDHEYPLLHGEHWVFVAQINLEDVAPFQDYLPRKGLLSFFAEDTNEFVRQSKVFYFEETAELHRYVYENATFVEEVFDGPVVEAACRFQSCVSLPELWKDRELLPEAAKVLDELDFKRCSGSRIDEYDATRSELVGEERVPGINRYVFAQHRGPEELAALDVVLNAKTGRKEPTDAEVNEWTVLLTVMDDQASGYDVSQSVLTFAIRKADLAEGRFDRVFASLECC